MALLINGQRVAGLGRPGVGIASIERTSGDGSPGTDDIYTITLTDGSTSEFSVHNGTDGVSSFKGRYGDVVPQAGDYTADMVGAAPAGYGLGDGAAFLDGVDLDTVRLNGWYRINTLCANAPTTSDGVSTCSNALLEVTSGGGSSYVREQIIHLGTSGQQGRKLRRFYNNASKAWQPWEWINPPMLVGAEYRTTERYLGKPVYTALVDFGEMPTSASSQKEEILSSHVNLVYCQLYQQASSGKSGPIETSQNRNKVTITTNTSGDVTITTTADLSAYNALILAKYTKE